jgi:transposase InsO family protein
MPWQEASTMSLRHEFVLLARQAGANRRALCRRFQISAKTGYKWLRRYERDGAAGLCDRSRRPRQSPRQTAAVVEAAVMAVRAAQPAWGGRKVRRRLKDLGRAAVPAASTITAIVRRHGGIDPAAAPAHRPLQRFEQARPNALWQMDFKGHFPLTTGGRCHPLTVLDDHSRFALQLQACGNEQTATVQLALTHCFQRYGLPERLLMDNGPPWGSDAAHPHTPLTAWLLRLGIGVTHGRPYHPQTQGKAERFHRTLALELLRTRPWRDLAHCQAAFDPWREVYNCQRPHAALELAVPASRYQPSARAFPHTLPPIEYAPDDVVRRVYDDGHISFHGRLLLVSKAFRGHPVGLRPTAVDGCFDVFFCHQRIVSFDLRTESR